MAKATNIVAYTADGVDYEVDLFSLSALEHLAAFQETGYRPSDLLQAATVGRQLDAIAALVWLHRRRTNPELPFAEVASSITWGDLVSEEEVQQGLSEHEAP